MIRQAATVEGRYVRGVTSGRPDERPHRGEDVAAKFTAAWEVFSRTCTAAVAPEATFQAWFAHYLISQFGIDRVAREPNFGHRTMFAPSPFVGRFQGQEIKLDVVVTRRPGIDMPHWVHRRDSKHGGTALLGDLAVISELKVASTRGKGLGYTAVCRDVWKLSMLLGEADRHVLEAPLAYVCILDNSKPKFSLTKLHEHLVKTPFDARVQILCHRARDQ